VTDAREPITPTLDVGLEVAVEEMTGFEALGIEKRFGRKMEDLGGMALLMGAVWVYENRDGKKASWNAIEAMTLRQLRGYFTESDDVVADDPDSESGKER
jgi:hypothetical protein